MLTRRNTMLQLLGLAAWTNGKLLRAGNPDPVLESRQVRVPLVNEDGAVISRYDASALHFIEDLGGGVGLDMALIPGGLFQMGSISNVPTPPTLMFEQPVHEVTVKSFALGVFPVTVGQWRQVAALPQISHSLHGIPAALDPNLPMDVVFGDEMNEFCLRLQSLTGRKYRLPSEAEWEYACRAGTKTKYHFGDGISLQVANYNDGMTRPLALTIGGSKQAPNRFGLHDMHGNVIEECSDWRHSRYDGAPQDGSAWTSDADPLTRVARGGSYLFGADTARSAARYPSDVRVAFGGGGFRLALDFPSDLLDPSIQQIANAASGLSGSLSPGEIVCIRGVNIGPPKPSSATTGQSGTLATQLSGIRVLFEGIPAVLLYVSSEQVNAVVPYALAGRVSAQIMLDSRGQTSAPVAVAVAPASPGIFTANAAGRGQAVALNQDGSLNSTSNPAARDSFVTLYATGEGQTVPTGVDGILGGAQLPAPILPVEILIGDVVAELQYAGGAPGQVAGLLQINARVPLDVQPGQQPVLLRVGEATSQPDVFIMVV